MTVALICSQAELEADLGHTLLWRRDVERHVATRLEDARMMAVAARPAVIVVDREFPRGEKLVTQLREDATTRAISIVVVARGDFDPSEVDLLEAGANAILRLPAGPDWDERLVKLIRVPARKDVRFSVMFAVDAMPGQGGPGIPALALNLSANGMLLESSVPLDMGEEVGLSFRLPGDGKAIAGSGRVVRQAAPTQFGIEFRQLESDGRDKVRRFVETLGTGPEGLANA